MIIGAPLQPTATQSPVIGLLFSILLFLFGLLGLSEKIRFLSKKEGIPLFTNSKTSVQITRR
jgi:hypothetical protein